MAEYLQRESNKITIANFYENFALKKYNFNPPYQRRSLWTDEKKSFFIDSIMRNFPIPPIFLHQKIDEESGKTTYDVIDGKQRLTSIIDFIEGNISVATEDGDDVNGNVVAGKYFEDFDLPELAKYKSHFWRYVIPIEYVDTGDQQVIDSIFDRLNRNGEPLNGQELRNSNYYGTKLLNIIEELTKYGFWKERLKDVDRNRMEDVEFLSEIAFLVIEKEELHADQEELDKLYSEYSSSDKIDYADLKLDLINITDFMKKLNLEYDNLKIAGVSHLYGIFSFSYYCIKNNVSHDIAKAGLDEFYNKLRTKDYENNLVKQYKDSMSSRTKNKTQRKRRREALVQFCINNGKN